MVTLIILIFISSWYSSVSSSLLDHQLHSMQYQSCQYALNYFIRQLCHHPVILISGLVVPAIRSRLLGPAPLPLPLPMCVADAKGPGLTKPHRQRPFTDSTQGIRQSETLAAHCRAHVFVLPSACLPRVLPKGASVTQGRLRLARRAPLARCAAGCYRLSGRP